MSPFYRSSIDSGKNKYQKPNFIGKEKIENSMGPQTINYSELVLQTDQETTYQVMVQKFYETGFIKVGENVMENMVEELFHKRDVWFKITTKADSDAILYIVQFYNHFPGSPDS